MALTAKPNRAGHRSRTTDEAMAEAMKEPVKGIIIRVPASKHRTLKAQTATNGETIQQVLERAIDAYINASS